MWKGPIETTRIIGHDKIPQMINYGKSSKQRLVFGVSGKNYEKLYKPNRECITVDPFSTMQGDTLMCQVIFSGSGHTSHMAPESVKNINELLITVNQSGVSDNCTLLAAYKELDRILSEKEIGRPVIILAD